MSKRPVTTAEAILGGAIAQALISRGDFAEGAFDKLLPKGVPLDDTPITTDPAAAKGIIMVATLSLTAARTAIDFVEAIAAMEQPPGDGDEWKKGKPPE